MNRLNCKKIIKLEQIHLHLLLHDNAPSKYTSGFLGGISTLERNFPVYLEENHIYQYSPSS